MNYIKTFELYTGHKRPESLTYIKKPVEIRIDVEAVSHAIDRKHRHGVDDNMRSIISNDEIIENIENSIEEITIALMQDQFNIYQDRDNYPTHGVKEGEPNRFIIRNKETDLNIVCELKAGDNEFTLTVITVMKKKDFREYRGQFVIEI